MIESKYWKKLNPENVAIAMHCNLRPPDVALVVVRFNYGAHTKVQVGQAICCCFIALYRWYSTLRCDLDLYNVILTVIRWPWTLYFIGCDVVKPFTKFERNRTIRGWVIAIWIFDFTTLNICCATFWDIFTKFKLSQPIRSWRVRIFDAETFVT